MKYFITATFKTVKTYFINILLWIDIGFNVFVMAGSPYETISSRVGKNAKKGKKMGNTIKENHRFFIWSRTLHKIRSI
jgi:hypothetical protein